MPLDANESLFAALRIQRDRFVGFAFASADLLIEISPDGQITFVTGAAQNLYGVANENLVGTRFIELIAPADRPVAAALVASLQHAGRLVPITLRLATEGEPAVTFGGCGLPGRKDAVYLSLAMGTCSPSDTKGRAGETMLNREDFADETTRRLLEETTNGYQLTLIALDELEALQNRLTEEVGQSLAATVERYLYSCAGGVDATGDLGNGRYGMLHKEAVDTARLRQGVENLTRAIDPAGQGVKLRAVTMPLDQDALSGTDAARALVYCINQFADSPAGDLSIPSLREGLDRALAETAARVGSLRATVAAGAFSIVYQPVVDLRSREIHHFEALARFPDGRSPGSAVAFAEAVRLIADFDLAVCQKVIANMVDLPEGAKPAAINLSGQSLESSVFTNALFEMLKGHRHLARRILFEVTESAIITRAEEVNARIQALRGSGFKVCLDDFGAGANSFHYLRSFEVDFIKIDGPLGKAALRNPRDLILLRSIANFCREIGIAVIVEMVEDEDDAIAFAKLGIPYAQGYHFGKPATLPDAKPVAGPKPPIAKLIRPARRIGRA